MRSGGSARTRRRIAANEASGRPRLVDALTLTDPKAAAEFQGMPLEGDAKRKLVGGTLANMSEIASGLHRFRSSGPEEKKLLQNLKTYDAELREIRKQDDAMTQQLAAFRADLRGQA